MELRKLIAEKRANPNCEGCDLLDDACDLMEEFIGLRALLAQADLSLQEKCKEIDRLLQKNGFSTE